MWTTRHAEILKIFGLYTAWVVAHYVSSHLYANYCTKPTVIGFITSPFLTMSPQCQAGRWIIYNGAYAINIMWILFAKWILNSIQYALPNIWLTSPNSTSNKEKKYEPNF